MNKKINLLFIPFLLLGLVPPVYAELGSTLLKVNAAIVIVTKASAMQKKYQGPDAAPLALHSPLPTRGGSAHYVSPFTTQGQVTEWAQAGMKASMAAAAGTQVGGRAAQLATGSLFSKVPVPGAAQLGAFFNKKATEKAAETSTAMAMGGWENIRAQSDVSFATADELVVYMHANHVEHPDYPSALAAAIALYPEVEERYEPAVEAAVEYAKENPVPESVLQARTALQTQDEVLAAAPAPQVEIPAEEKKRKGLFSAFSGVTSMFSDSDKKPEPEIETVKEDVTKAAPPEVEKPVTEVEAEIEVASSTQAEMRTELASHSQETNQEEAEEKLARIFEYDPAMRVSKAQLQAGAEMDGQLAIEEEITPEVNHESSVRQSPTSGQTSTFKSLNDVEEISAPEEKASLERPEPAVMDVPAKPIRVAVVPKPSPLGIDYSNGLTVEDRLAILTKVRVNGQITGDEYLAERKRVINGEIAY